MSLTARCRVRSTIDLPIRFATCSSSFATPGYGTTKRNRARTILGHRHIIRCQMKFPRADVCLSLSNLRRHYLKCRVVASKLRCPSPASRKSFLKQDSHYTNSKQRAPSPCTRVTLICRFEALYQPVSGRIPKRWKRRSRK